MGRNCDDALANVYAYLDRELDDSTATAIRGHLVDCPPCEHAFDFEDRLKSVIQERLKVDVPNDFLERLRGVLRGDPC